jgi:hypothetical protein
MWIILWISGKLSELVGGKEVENKEKNGDKFHRQPYKCRYTV